MRAQKLKNLRNNVPLQGYLRVPQSLTSAQESAMHRSASSLGPHLAEAPSSVRGPAQVACTASGQEPSMEPESVKPGVGFRCYLSGR